MLLTILLTLVLFFWACRCCAAVDTDDDTPWCKAAGGTVKLYLQSGQFSTTIRTSEDVSSFNARLTGISWTGTDTPWSGGQSGPGPTPIARLFLQSGQFSSTLLTSEDVTPGPATSIKGISWDGTNTPYVLGTKLLLGSGQFTTTVIDSENILSFDTNPNGISWDGANTPWCGTTDERLYLQAGQFTSTLLISQHIGLTDTGIFDISWDGANTPWCGTTGSKLYLQSGQFTTTLITSASVVNPEGINTNKRTTG